MWPLMWSHISLEVYVHQCHQLGCMDTQHTKVSYVAVRQTDTPQSAT